MKGLLWLFLMNFGYIVPSISQNRVLSDIDGTVIAHQPASTQRYIGSPSIAKVCGLAHIGQRYHHGKPAAYAVGAEVANNNHDANFLTFHRIAGFREKARQTL